MNYLWGLKLIILKDRSDEKREEQQVECILEKEEQTTKLMGSSATHGKSKTDLENMRSKDYNTVQTRKTFKCMIADIGKDKN